MKRIGDRLPTDSPAAQERRIHKFNLRDNPRLESRDGLKAIRALAEVLVVGPKKCLVVDEIGIGHTDLNLKNWVRQPGIKVLNYTPNAEKKKKGVSNSAAVIMGVVLKVTYSAVVSCQIDTCMMLMINSHFDRNLIDLY